MTLTVPPDRVARLVDALEHLSAAAGEPAAAEHRDSLARSGRLTAPRDLLRELLTVAIDEAAEALSGHCTRLLRGTGSREPVRAGVDELGALLDLLDTVERG
jgi:hypothetical protein